MDSSTVDVNAQVAIVVAGIVWPILFQILSDIHGLQDRAAQAVAVGFCYVLAAAVVILIQHQAVTVANIITDGSEITAVSVLVYRQVIKPMLPDSPIAAPKLPPVTPLN